MKIAKRLTGWSLMTSQAIGAAVLASIAALVLPACIHYLTVPNVKKYTGDGEIYPVRVYGLNGYEIVLGEIDFSKPFAADYRLSGLPQDWGRLMIQVQLQGSPQEWGAPGEEPPMNWDAVRKGLDGILAMKATADDGTIVFECKAPVSDWSMRGDGRLYYWKYVPRSEQGTVIRESSWLSGKWAKGPKQVLLHVAYEPNGHAPPLRGTIFAASDAGI